MSSIDSLSVNELREILRSLNLKTAGKKSELIARLCFNGYFSLEKLPDNINEETKKRHLHKLTSVLIKADVKLNEIFPIIADLYGFDVDSFTEIDNNYGNLQPKK